MSKFLHLKDAFDNDMWFGDCNGEFIMPAFPNVEDFSTQLQKIREISLRPDDVIVVGYPKSGNNWTHQMVTLLQKGTTELGAPILRSDNYFFLDAISADTKLIEPDQPRVLQSHLPFRFLPSDVLEKKVKLVYVTRNPKDVYVSYFCHLGKMDPPLNYVGTWPQFFSVMLEQGFGYGDVFDHMKDWEKRIESHPDHPIYICNFEDSKRDMLGQVEGLNQFLGTNRSRQLCEDIVKTCQFSNMHVTRSASPTLLKSTLWKEEKMTSFYRKGIVGDWKNWFTVAQNEQFDDVYVAKMADSKRSFVFE